MSPVPDDHHRITVDVHHGTFQRLDQQLNEINAARPDYQGKETKASLIRGLLGSWLQGEIPTNQRHTKRGRDRGF